MPPVTQALLIANVAVFFLASMAGGPVCAVSLRLPPTELETSIRVHDSLEHGLSYFMAALARLKGVVDRSQHPREGRTVMYLLDEVLQRFADGAGGLVVYDDSSGRLAIALDGGSAAERLGAGRDVELRITPAR